MLCISGGSQTFSFLAVSDSSTARMLLFTTFSILADVSSTIWMVMNMHTIRKPTNITNERLIHAGLMTNLFYSQTTQSSAPNYSITPFVSESDSLFREFLRFLLFSHKRIIYYCIIITKEYQYNHTQAGPPMMVGNPEDNSSPTAVVVRSHSHPAPILLTTYEVNKHD